MAKYTANLSANGDVYVCTIRRPSGGGIWSGRFLVYGTFGSGTVALKLSPDGGTTKISLKDSAGAIAITSNDVVDMPISGYSDKNNESLTIYASLSGATSPSITIEVWDNT